jgi:hypothetical protein
MFFGVSSTKEVCRFGAGRFVRFSANSRLLAVYVSLLANMRAF